MKTCWLCREPLPEDFQPNVDDNCPSCLTIIDGKGKATGDPGLMNTYIALARAVDRLTKQLGYEVERQRSVNRKRMGLK
jgi:hypothetical protein